MSLFRSERMNYYNISFPRESAWEILNELGETDGIQFLDQNSHDAHFNRPFYGMIKRCEEIENKLRLIEVQMNRFGREITPQEDVTQYLQSLKQYLSTRQNAEVTYFEEVEIQVDKQTTNIMDQVQSYEEIRQKFFYFQDYKKVLQAARDILGSTQLYAIRDMSNQEDEENEYSVNLIEERMKNDPYYKNNQVNYITGVLYEEDAPRFQKILFRATKGNCFVYFTNIQYQDTNDIQPKNEQVILINFTQYIFTQYNIQLYIKFIYDITQQLNKLIINNNIYGFIQIYLYIYIFILFLFFI